MDTTFDPVQLVNTIYNQRTKEIENGKNFLIGLIGISLATFHALLILYISEPNIFPLKFIATKEPFVIKNYFAYTFVILLIVGLFLECSALWLFYTRKDKYEKLAVARFEDSLMFLSKSDLNDTDFNKAITLAKDEIRKISNELRSSKRIALGGLILLIIDSLIIIIPKLFNGYFL